MSDKPIQPKKSIYDIEVFAAICRIPGWLSICAFTPVWIFAGWHWAWKVGLTGICLSLTSVILQTFLKMALKNTPDAPR